MATDGWNAARAAAVGLWQRVHPERVPAIEAELEEVHQELLASGSPADTETALAAEWQRKLRRLLVEHPGLAEEMQRILDEQWKPLLSEDDQVRVQRVTMIAHVKDEGRAYQAARDQIFRND